MKKRNLAPNSPEVTQAVLEDIRKMSREELLAELNWRPEGVPETWRNENGASGREPGNGASRAGRETP